MNVKFTGKIISAGQVQMGTSQNEPNGVPKSMLLRN